MKNQYFGDVNDYRKYGVLRALTGSGRLSATVCWMLTSDDGSTDGRFVAYKDEPEEWRKFDPKLFELLSKALAARERYVNVVESSDLFPRFQFFSRVLSDNAREREAYFEDFFREARGSDLMFFDPDNGFEVKSRRFGGKNSSKYLYWREVERAAKEGSSILCYQHFTRESRDAFVGRIGAELRERTDVDAVIAFQTPQVVFFLAAQPRHREYLEARAERIASVWAKQIEVRSLF